MKIEISEQRLEELEKKEELLAHLRDNFLFIHFGRMAELDNRNYSYQDVIKSFERIYDSLRLTERKA